MRSPWFAVAALVLALAFSGCGPMEQDDVLSTDESGLGRVFSGTVSSTGTAWLSHNVTVSAPSTVVATLTWSKASADLNLFLADASGKSLGGTGGSTSRPESLSMQLAAGTYRFGVKAVSGASAYTLTVDVTPVAPPCTAKFPGDPSCSKKMYYGAAVEGGEPAVLERQVGRGLTVFRSYMQPTTPASKLVSRATDDIANGRIPLISTKVPGSWADVADGKQDAWLLERIRALAAVSGTVWLCLHHEPSNDGAPADWVRMQQHARKLIDANSHNIALVGILNGWDFQKKNGTPQMWNHPVGSGVHVMGFDSYNPWSPTNGAQWKSVPDTFSPGLAIQAWGYPTLVGEYGVRTDPRNPGKAAQWLKEAFDFTLANHFVSISFFDSGANSPDGTWELDGERLTAFSQQLARPEVAHP